MMVTVVAAVPDAFVTVTVTLLVPTAVGVPELNPVEVLTLRPAGKTEH